MEIRVVIMNEVCKLFEHDVSFEIDEEIITRVRGGNCFVVSTVKIGNDFLIEARLRSHDNGDIIT